MLIFHRSGPLVWNSSKTLLRTGTATSTGAFHSSHRRLTQQSSPSNPIMSNNPSSSHRSLRLLSPQQVQDEGLENFKILDASFHLPNSNRSSLDEFRSKARLPKSTLFDHDAIANTHYTILDQPQNSIRLAHMQPDLATFQRAMESLALTRDDHILFYDSIGIFSSPRAAWLLHSYGHPRISVLDGGLPRWIHEKRPVETGEPHDDHHPSTTSSRSNYLFEYSLDEHQRSARQRVISYEDVLKNIESVDRAVLFDARPHGRFLGTDPEPRPGLSSGHVPASISLPFTKLLTTPKDPKTEPYRTYLGPQELENVFLEAPGHDRDRWERIKSGETDLIVSCGSGMTACIIWLAVHLCHGSLDRIRLYDESWSGYAARKNSPIEIAPSPIPDPPRTITTTIV